MSIMSVGQELIQIPILLEYRFIMYAYLKGIITEQGLNYIVLENNNIGYKINVANPFSYVINNEYKVYLYNHIRED